MHTVRTIDELEALYGDAVPLAIKKVAGYVTPLYRQWIEACRFVVIATVGPEGTDASPRGDAGPVVRIADPKTILLPDWLGNNRVDTLRNIVRDGRASMMFMVPGSENVVRINGTASLSVAPDLLASFERNGKQPRSVIVFEVREIYFQCAKALKRSQLWAEPGAIDDLPTAGQFINEAEAGFDAEAYDAGYDSYAAGRMW